jgi:tripartite-type tricarboxylate transporter receptor subunit TctC
VARSAPDGNTLLVSDASPITVLVRFPWVVAVHPSVPANSFQELVACARARPGALSYGSFGLGSSAHISVDYLKKLLGIVSKSSPTRPRSSPRFSAPSTSAGRKSSSSRG